MCVDQERVFVAVKFLTKLWSQQKFQLDMHFYSANIFHHLPGGWKVFIGTVLFLVKICEDEKYDPLQKESAARMFIAF